MKRTAIATVALALLTSCVPGRQPVTLHPADNIPARLSEWGVVFADGDSFSLNDNVVPYDLNTPLFSDYALKLRTVWLPSASAASYRERDEFDFPVGTIISKTFHYEKAADWSPSVQRVVATDRNTTTDEQGGLPLDVYSLIETRLLVRYDAGWKAYPYVWNSEQNEAFLELAGDLRALELVGPDSDQAITYVVPDVNQCGGCHTPNHSAKELRPLGPRAWQLNRDYDYAGNVQNQIEHWQSLGILQGVTTPVPGGVNWIAPEGASLDERARAYLDANCAHCHNPEGAADTSALHLNIDSPLDRHFGICKGPIAVGRGSGDRPFDIYPGRPDDSILLFRMQHSDPAIAMPELGRSAVHTEAVALIREWIAAMPGDCQAYSNVEVAPVVAHGS